MGTQYRFPLPILYMEKEYLGAMMYWTDLKMRWDNVIGYTEESLDSRLLNYRLPYQERYFPDSIKSTFDCYLIALFDFQQSRFFEPFKQDVNSWTADAFENFLLDYNIIYSEDVIQAVPPLIRRSSLEQEALKQQILFQQASSKKQSESFLASKGILPLLFLPLVSKEIPQLVSKEIPQLVSKEIPQLVSKEIPQLVSKEIPQLVSKETLNIGFLFEKVEKFGISLQTFTFFLCLLSIVKSSENSELTSLNLSLKDFNRKFKNLFGYVKTREFTKYLNKLVQTELSVYNSQKNQFDTITLIQKVVFSSNGKKTKTEKEIFNEVEIFFSNEILMNFGETYTKVCFSIQDLMLLKKNLSKPLKGPLPQTVTFQLLSILTKFCNRNEINFDFSFTELASQDRLLIEQILIEFKKTTLARIPHLDYRIEEDTVYLIQVCGISTTDLQ